MTQSFVPRDEQRKEKKFVAKQSSLNRANDEGHLMRQRANNGVSISAYDPWAMRPRRATLVDRVIIKTDIPLPRDVWLHVHTYLEQEVSKRRPK